MENEQIKSPSDVLPTNRKLIVSWLILVAILVFVMIVLGGVTRLTNSGLSMTDWKPVTGWLPPLSDQAWTAEFERYKAFPEYQQVNKGMSLSEFKGIYAFEFAHRVLGRIIGLAFFIPFVLFLVFGRIRGKLVPRLAILLILGGLQGGMGWFMVKSGLVDDPDVSHYRLTAHLALASLIYSVILWTVFDLLRPEKSRASRDDRSVRFWSMTLLILISLQILIGGFVAGLNAGFVFNDWPLMAGQFVPEEFLYMQPWYVNFLENPAAIQFSHRMVAYVIAVISVLLYLISRDQNIALSVRSSISYLLIVVFLQIFIGILTLLYVVPVSLGALHQAGGIIVLTFSLFVVHELYGRRSYD
ncbi:COX15/CtaA family protein [Sneathiella marina]|uniref:Heme A synthase n=1 Tax=Sneathiella marina TaxID=2950108 RepID=A0ABY4VYQ4_9PROT|nr:COX15/CtaA family protein [Sneathiella marina]USG60058.1 COX15/CtaA family protein [Sneathiella marina]